MVKEIGGYIELDSYHLQMLHKGAIALNCGRNALAYVLKGRKIRKIKIPYLLCSSIPDTCNREGVMFSYYHIQRDFHPVESLELEANEWLYLVNYYGQLSNEQIKTLVQRYERVIVDQAQSYFQPPIPGVDTIYVCRKYFGVADGAFLYSDIKLDSPLDQDESFNRMRFLLGRYERTASEFYEEYIENNRFFANERIKYMSKLTTNLLCGIDYETVKNVRESNYRYLQKQFCDRNILKIAEFPGTFMYPLMVGDGESVRKILLEKRIYIPLLWPYVLNVTRQTDVEYQFAKNILPLPIDQRYGNEEMEYLSDIVLNVLADSVL